MSYEVHALGKDSQSLLVLDAYNVSVLPRHFRHTDMELDLKYNKQGFKDLKLIGSGQFSKLQLEKVLQLFLRKNITIIDLRQESHGFLNSHAISWYGAHNALNHKRSNDQIESQQSLLLKEVSNRHEVFVYQVLHKTPDEMIDKTKTLLFKVHEVLDESEFIKHFRIPYYRLYVQDFHAPNRQTVNDFIQFVQQLPHDQWLYLHCRAGVGRTTLFMVMYDIIRNAKEISLEDILRRHHAIGGKDLRVLPDRSAYKYELSLKRMEFIEHFYEYVRLNQDHFQTSY